MYLHLGHLSACILLDLPLEIMSALIQYIHEVCKVLCKAGCASHAS